MLKNAVKEADVVVNSEKIILFVVRLIAEAEADVDMVMFKCLAGRSNVTVYTLDVPGKYTSDPETLINDFE